MWPRETFQTTLVSNENLKEIQCFSKYFCCNPQSEIHFAALPTQEVEIRGIAVQGQQEQTKDTPSPPISKACACNLSYPGSLGITVQGPSPPQAKKLFLI
jgi:hypothetical protein